MENQESETLTHLVASDMPYILEIDDLSKSYGRFKAVDRLRLRLREGEIYGFLGRNGAGKTTTIRMLMGIIKENAGQIKLFGNPTRFYRSSKYKQQMGYVSQEQFFYPWMTCSGIGRFVGPMYKTWDKVEFSHLLEKLELPPDRKIRELSHGMKVKLALALAVAHRPRLLILDEPTAGLDPVTRRDFLDMILHQRNEHGRTIFFSTHLLDEAERTADTIGVIAKGNMRYEGSKSALQDYVRKVTTPAGVSEGIPFPPSLELLRTEVTEQGAEHYLAGPAEAWCELSGGWTVEGLSLEDVFIELSGKSRVDL